MKIIFIALDGQLTEIPTEDNHTAMQVAVDNGIEGIVAECRGALACATCHVYVSDEWINHLKPVSADEDEMLGCVRERRPNSRLSCQIALTSELDGLTLYLPETQI